MNSAEITLSVGVLLLIAWMLFESVGRTANHRNWPQISLRSLLIVMTLAALALARFSNLN
jgi:hypothetical protein